MPIPFLVKSIRFSIQSLPNFCSSNPCAHTAYCCSGVAFGSLRMLRSLVKLMPVPRGVTSKLTLTCSYPWNLLTAFINAPAIGKLARSSPTIIIMSSYRGGLPGNGLINSCFIFCMIDPPCCTVLILLAYSGYNLCHVCTLTAGGIGSSLPSAFPINKYGSPLTSLALLTV